MNWKLRDCKLWWNAKLKRRTTYRRFETFTSRTDYYYYYYYQYQNRERYFNNETIQLKVWTIIATTPKKIRLKNCIKCNTTITFRNNRKQTFAITLSRRWNGFGMREWAAEWQKKIITIYGDLFFSFIFLLSQRSESNEQQKYEYI